MAAKRNKLCPLGMMTALWLPLMVLEAFYLRDFSLSGRLGEAVLFSALIGLTAAGYSMAMAVRLGLRVYCPRLWIGRTDIREQAGPELEAVPRKTRFTYWLTLLPPLVLAGVVWRTSQSLPLLVVCGGLTLFALLHFALSSVHLARLLFPFSSRRG